MSSQFPNYMDYEDDYERYYQKLTKGPFLDEISIEEAESYFYVLTSNVNHRTISSLLILLIIPLSTSKVKYIKISLLKLT